MEPCAFMRKTLMTLTAGALAGTLFLAACSNDEKKTPDTTGDTTVSTDAASTTVNTAIVPPTLKPGSTTPLGSVDSSIQTLEAKCADALKPIRDLEKKYKSGLEMQGADRDAFNKALSAGFGACKDTDWAAFQEKELKGWMNAIPGSTPTAPAGGSDTSVASTETTTA